jgi:transcription elongation factor Elf1
MAYGHHLIVVCRVCWLNFVEDSTKTSEKIGVYSDVGGVFWKTPPQTPENGC